MEKMDNKKIAGERISCKPRGRWGGYEDCGDEF
jgi:hypothetical protein